MKTLFVVLILAASTTDSGQAGKFVQRLNPPSLSKPPGTPPAYSHVVVVKGGRTIYVSGEVPRDKEGKLVGTGDFTAQAKQVFENLKAALAAADATFDDVVKINIYLTDAANLDKFREVRAQYTGDHPPASTGMVVARLLQPDYLLEVDAIAVTAR